ncbi:NAD(P)/FAD-dependent oxidoreductase [Nocardioides salsibiostraticola]
MKRHHDLLVIGAGMAGVAAANKAADSGWSVAIVDDLPYGGTCALRGCDPKKILRRGAEILDSAHLMRGKGIDAGGLAINWSDLMKHKHGFTDPVPANMESGLASRGVDLLHGRAVFTGPQDLDINGTSHTAEHVLVATGAAPRPLDFPGHERLIDSTEFLDLDSLPARILFVGGGFISFEFAHIAARAGSQVTIVHRGERPLTGFDPDLVERVVARGLDWGIDVRTSTSILAVEAGATGELVTLESNGVRESLEADLVVHGAGRVPALEGLGLEAAGVDYGRQGVRVEPHLRSVSNPAVWAAGDAADTAGMALTPVAVSEAKVAASNMLKQRTTAPDYAGIPTAVFTIPELTRVGLLEQEARDRNIDLDVRFHDTSGWYSNYRIGETTAAAKVLVDRSTDLIVGAHLLGPEYAELINPIGLAIKLGLTTRQLKSATAAYPSVGSDLGALL